MTRLMRLTAPILATAVAALGPSDIPPSEDVETRPLDDAEIQPLGDAEIRPSDETQIQPSGDAETGLIYVLVPNARAVEGLIQVDVCREAEFLEECPISATADVMPGGTVVVVRDVPYGQYGIQLFHDENGDGKIDRGLFGIPREGVGFSNDHRIGFRAPRFDEVQFVVDSDETSLLISLQYF